MTKSQLLALVFAFILRHHLSKTCLQDLLSVLCSLIPNCIPKSKYSFYKEFSQPSTKVILHYKCPVCESYLGEDLSVDQVFFCEFCQAHFTAKCCYKSKDYFLTSSIEQQLKNNLEGTNLWDHIEKTKLNLRNVHDNGVRGEVFTGANYNQEELKKFLRSGDNVSVTFSTDGISMSKSTPFEIWPIVLTINELDFTNKGRFVILSTLWFGPKKPTSETFFHPFITELRRLFADGFVWVRNGISRKTKVVSVIGVLDAPARAKVANYHQHNGEFGCGYCLERGKRVAKGDGTVQIYPLVNPLPPCRTHASTLALATDAINNPRVSHVMGVKGPSILFLLPGFNLITGLIPDYMHCLLLGVVYQFLDLWLNAVGKAYYIKKASFIDEILLNIFPPNEIRRTPRSVEQLSLWKASELRNWLLFYSPVVLYFLLPSKYYQHWLLLVNAFRILLKKEVSQSEIQNVKILIHKFISEIPHLYGEEHCTYNVHVLQHIPDSVNNWGAPWASSSFLYEDLGRILKSFFHGTTYLGEQIFNSFLAKQQLREYARSFIPLAEESVRDLYGKLDSQVGSDYSSYSANHSIPTPLGKKILIKLTVSEVLAIETKYRIILNCVNAFSYQRFGLNGKMYSTKSYSTQFKRQNCVICDVKGNGLEIKKFCSVTSKL
jgi:hypothetical protein